jgi:putative transcriptional regulator
MIKHHPGEETLVRFATGDLQAGPALIVATHLSQCPVCRATVRSLESVGGSLLELADPVPVKADVAALLADPDAALRKLEARSLRFRQQLAAPAPRLPKRAPLFPNDMLLPAPMAAYDISNWRPIGPGIHWAKLNMPDNKAEKVLLLKARSGTHLPLHTHTGTEYTCILHGSFSDDGQTIATGDLVECDQDVVHEPLVDSDVDCVCVISVEGRLLMNGWLARLAQRLVGL